MNTNEVILQYLKELGITAVGFCDVEPLKGYADFIEKEHRILEDSSIYLDINDQKTMDKTDWFNPLELLPAAKTIIVILLPYNLGVIKSNRPKVENQFFDSSVSHLSKGSIFEDYHKIVNRKLESLRNYIMVNHDMQSMSFCDFGPLNDKAVALKSGLLKIGRNSLLYHPKYGSRFYIGYLITELVCETHSAHIVQRNEWESYFHPYCNQCGRCQASCPNQAIERFGHLKSRHCISFLTQSKEWTLENAKNGLIDPLNNYAYGCDICQKVCPLNGIALDENEYDALVPEQISLADINLTKKEFKESYGRTSVGWIGKKRLERNILWNEFWNNRSQH